MPMRDVLGWLLFLLSAALFAVAGLRADDPLVVVGSAVFGFACLLFLSHAATSLRRSTPTGEGVGSHDAG